jgi:hypothetical protein
LLRCEFTRLDEFLGGRFMIASLRDQADRLAVKLSNGVLVGSLEASISCTRFCNISAVAAASDDTTACDQASKGSKVRTISSSKACGIMRNNDKLVSFGKLFN